MSEHFAPAEPNKQAGFAPCFPVTDMSAALEHYEELGFIVMPYEQGAQWAWVRFGNAEIHLYLKEDHDPARTAAAADLLEAVHVDLDNNLIRFGSTLRRAE
jgi:hypothetical protein